MSFKIILNNTSSFFLFLKIKMYFIIIYQNVYKSGPKVDFSSQVDNILL